VEASLLVLTFPISVLPNIMVLRCRAQNAQSVVSAKAVLHWHG